MNLLGISGRLTADCEIKAIGDSNVINFSIANNDEQRKKDDGTYENVVSFFNVSFWNKSGKMARHLIKGKAVTITGRLKQQRWTDQEGKNQGRIVINAVKVEPHAYESAGGAGQSGDNYTPEPEPEPGTQQGAPTGDDELPF